MRHSPRSVADNQGAEIAHVVAGRAHIREQDAPDVVNVLAGFFDLDRRDAQAFVENLGRLAGEAGRRHASHLADVADRDRKTDQVAVDKYRLEKGMFGRMQAAAIGIVVEDHVTFLEILDGDFVDTGTDQQGHAADHRRTEVAGRDHLAVGERQRAGEIE